MPSHRAIGLRSFSRSKYCTTHSIALLCAQGITERPVNPTLFYKELNQIKQNHLSAQTNVGSYQSHQCERCALCMFSSACFDCYRCTHCQDCRFCTQCSHSAECDSCHQCAYCIQCQHCSNSSYLVLCTACNECIYCFGCAGLNKQEFHILNQPYSRQEYFKVTKQLSYELKIRLTP